MKIVFLDMYNSNPGDIDTAMFKELGEFITYDRTNPSDIKERIKDADIVITNKVRLGKAELEGTKVKFIAEAATGFDNIDLNALKELGIGLANVPSYSTYSVVQLTLAHLLNATNDVYSYAKNVRNGEWVDSRDFNFFLGTIHELAGKTAAIVGYGDIGQKVADAYRALGMKVIALKVAGHNADGDFFRDYEDFFKEADIVSLHAPMNADSKEIINKDSLALMKNTAIIINTARGGLINEADLADALKNGKVAFYASDVSAPEPMTKDNKLYALDNAAFTPHIAWASLEARQRLYKVIYDNIKAYIDGRSLNRIV